jgi:hypothetical protein
MRGFIGCRPVSEDTPHIRCRTQGWSVPHRMAPRRSGDPPELVADPVAALALLGEDLVKRSDLRQIIEPAWNWYGSSLRLREIGGAGADVAAPAAFGCQAAAQMSGGPG